MTYTAEQLRDMASLIEEQEVPTDGQQIKMLRAHADALEENARLDKLVSNQGIRLMEAEDAEAELAKLRKMVAQQAEDDGLWFSAATAPEAYLQQELRRLHAAVEGAK